jgi:hypothetical protein
MRVACGRFAGRIRLKVSHGTPKLSDGHTISAAAYTPIDIPTMPQTAAASRNSRTTWSL